MSEPRKFTDYDPAEGVLKVMPLLISITAPSFGGKSYSAGRLAVGIQRVVGGQIYWIDTENDRALELHKRYGGPFEFRHVPFHHPKSPQEYEQALKFCLAKPDCGVIIIDNMSAEHVALLDMMEEYFTRKGISDNWEKREKATMAAQVIPKAHRKHFNEVAAFGAMRPDGRKVPIIFLYRAVDKTKPSTKIETDASGKTYKKMEIVHVGWQAETTSPLPALMTARFLLPPASDGHPNLNPDTEFEKLVVKNPQQFRGWFAPGFQLTEEVGERMARWAYPATDSATKPDPDRAVVLLAEIEAHLRTLLSQDAKKEALQSAFGATWKQVKEMPVDKLEAGLTKLKPSAAAVCKDALDVYVDEVVADLGIPPDCAVGDRLVLLGAELGLDWEKVNAIVGGLAGLLPEFEDEMVDKLRRAAAGGG